MENSFLQQVARELLQRFPRLAECVLVFPQRRAITVFKGILGEKAPQMLTMTRLMYTAARQKKADSATMHFRIYRAYCKVCSVRGNAPMAFDDFFPWSEMMLNDFNDVDISLADARSVFRETGSIKDIEMQTFAGEESLKSLKEYFSTFWQAFDGSMRAKFREMWNMLADIYLETNALCSRTAYEGAIYRAGCRNVLQTTSGAHYVFIGFNVLSGAERRVMEHLKQQGRATFFWDHTPQFLGSDSEAVQAVSKNISSLGGHTSLAPEELLPPIHLVESATQSGEAAYVARWLDSLSHAKGGFTAVIPMDPKIMGTLRHFLPSSRYSFNVEYPVTLSRTYTRLMHHAQGMMQDNRAITGRELLEALKADAAQCAPDGTGNDSTFEKKSQDAVTTALTAILQLADDNPEVVFSPQMALTLFRSACRPQGGDEDSSEEPREAKRRVDVLDLHDTRTIDYDNVLLLDCNEGSMPPKLQQPSMLPVAVRRAYGLPLPWERNAVVAYNFFRLVKRSQNISAVYCSASTGKGETSRYLLQILAGETTRSVVAENITSPAAITPLQPVAVEKTPDMLASIKKLEPTPLSTYLECPLKFYYSKVARLRPPEPDADEMPSNLFGTLLHETMQIYYDSLPSSIVISQMLRPDLADKARRRLNSCIDKAFEVCHVNENSIIRALIIRYFVTMLEYDAKQAPFEIKKQYIEKFLYTPFPTPGGHTVGIGGKFDRVHIKDGVWVVADYKAGRWSGQAQAKTFSEAVEKPNTKKHTGYILQTMVYSLALIDKLRHDGISYPTLRPELYFVTGMGRKDFSPYIAIGGEPVGNFALYESEVREALQGIVNSIFDLTKPFAPCPEGSEACKNCDYRLLCGRKAKN